MHTVIRWVGAKNVQTTAVANTPSGVPSTNDVFIARTNCDWSMKLTNRRINPRSTAASCPTAAPWPATSATSRRLIRPVAQLLA